LTTIADNLMKFAAHVLHSMLNKVA